jgi:ribonuclease D
MPDRLAALARRAGRLAIDTEFVAERRYQAMLCLAQVAVRDGDDAGRIVTRIIDPLDGDDPAELTAVLADPAVEVVVHAGRQDVAILKRSWDTTLTNVFDTQVAAGFLGHGLQESYKSLVDRVLGIRIASSESFTRWERRPLTEEQLRYAAEDATHLLELGEALEARLAEAGRLEWAREECRALEAWTDERDPDALFLRLPGAARLRGRSRAIARELVDWRERTAREADRNAGSVLPDHVLVELARQAPARRETLADVRGLPEATGRRRARELLDAIARGAEREPPPRPPAGPAPRSQDAPLAALLSAVVRRRSQETGIAAQLIATQDDLTRLIAALRAGESRLDLPIVRGWRREVVGEELLEVLAGRRSVRVGADMQLLVEAQAAS